MLAKKKEKSPEKLDTVITGQSENTDSYILIPKKVRTLGNANIAETINSASEKLEEKNIKVDEKFSAIGAFTVNSLNEEQKKELDKDGFYIYKDKFENWLPEKNPEEMAMQQDDKNLLKNDYEIRDNPQGPTFGTDDEILKKYTGKNVGIAIIDTGIYPHPDLTSPRNKITGWVDFVNGKRIPYDDGGHGTHVSGDAAGTGYLSDGKYKSFAPDANLIGIKVLAGNGGGTTAALLQGIEWAIQHKDEHNIKVINISIGHKAEDYSTDPVDIALEQAVKAGITVVTSAGNSGPNPGTILAPGDSPYVITVGALDDRGTPDRKDDKPVYFSSCGPTPLGLTKPDILVRGEHIVSLFSPESVADKDNTSMAGKFAKLKELQGLNDTDLMNVTDETLSSSCGLFPDTIKRFRESPASARDVLKRNMYWNARMHVLLEAYISMCGSSMASPIASAVVAAMYEANPDLTPHQVKDILMTTAEKLPDYPDNQQGAGYMDPVRAILKAEELRSK
jgi:serine protease AprX